MTTFSSLASVYAQLTNFAISVEQSATLVSDTVVGDFGTVWVSDNYAYVGNNDSGVQIFDISNPVSPILKSNYGYYNSIPAEGFNAKEIEVVGSYAYIASWDKGLKILDISDRGNPVSIATLAIPGQSYGTTGLQVVGNYAYVTNINSGLSIIDITNPSNPTLKGSYAGEGWDVQVIGDYAYIANGYSGLQIVNISDPTAPTLINNFLGSPFYRQRGIEIVGNYAYVANELQGLLIIDISNPSAPILKGTYDTPGEAIRVSVEGNYAYVADDTYGLQIVNISNPTNPTLAENYDTSGSVADVKVIGDYAYVADGVGGLKIIDVSDMTANPIGTGVISFSDSQFSVNEDGTPVNQIALTRTEGSTGEVSVTLNLTDGTATAGSDYDATPITVTFTDGETSKIVDIPIINDSLIDGQETINLSLANSTNGATLGTQTTAILKVFDNDIPTTGNWVSVSNGDFESGNTNSWFGVAGERGTMGVSDDRSLFGNFSAKATTTSGFNGYGYGLVQVVNGLVVGEKYVLSGFIYTGELTSGQTYLDLNDIPNDPTARTLNNGVNQWQFVSTEFVASSSQVTVRVVRDGDVKADESAYVDEVAITPFNQFVPVDIPMNGAIAFSNSQFSVNEDGTPTTQITLTRTGGSTGEVSVTLNLTDGTATAGSDYDGTPITVTFADGETTKIVTIPIVNDILSEPNETINLTLSNPTNGATLGTQTTASLTILDDDINNATLLNPVNFTLNGSAKFTVGVDGVSPVLRLTDDYYQLGRAFLNNTIMLSNNTSFSSYFEFQISARGWGDEDGIGADGLSFAIQAASSDVDNVGSVEIEFDTFNNTPNNISDINGNHVGVNINGDINSVVSQSVTNRLNNGNIWSAWVDYNGVSDVLEVRISETNLRPTTAFLSYTVDLPSVLGQTDAFIGFTSRTGAGTGDHDILDWQFNNSYNPITEIANSELDFSGVQGLNNWYYGYYDGPFNSPDFQQMTQFNNDGSGAWKVEVGAYWTGIGPMTAHGNGTNGHPGMAPIEQWAVRRWVSEANGTIQIEGHLAKTGMGGNGVIGRIFVDGVEIWSQSIDGYDSTGINYQIETVVNLNSIVDFALDPRESNDYYDTTIFTAQIKGIESDSPGILSFSSSQFSVNEDGTPITQVTLTRTEGSTGEVSVTLNLTDGTATVGNDYDGTPITVTFSDGETSKTVDIPIVDDTLYEGDEILNLTLTNPTNGATLGTQQTATLNIVDNETPPPPSLLQVRLNLLKDNDGNPGDIINNDQIGLYQSFFVEILVGDFRDNAVGVNGLQLDFNWDGLILESINFDPANIINSQFPLLQGGTLDNPNGLIDDLSGGSLPAFELGQAIGINQLDRFALLHFYAENITNGISYLTTAVDSVSLADDASYVLDVETAQPLEVLSTYSQYTFTYHYGNGDYYSGYGYALADTYTLGQILSGYANETGNLGYYTIDSISPSTFDSSYNGQVYVTSYTDADTNYGYGTTTNIVGNTGYSGLGSESGNAYTAEGNAYDSFFSNDAEADLVIPTISITDNSGNATDASIRFTTELSKFRKNYQDSNFVRPNYADSSKYFDITNTGTGKLTISELRINVAGVSSDLNLTQGDLLLNPNESQRVKLTYAPSAAKEILERSDALVLVTNAINSPELAIALSGKSTFNSDVNYDGKVGVDDLGSLNQGKANLKKGIYDPTADISGDGLFNNLDVAMLQSENKLSLFA